ncbi:MAG: acyl-CoA dehydrogenase family protein [Stellaceae bacterium]
MQAVRQEPTDLLERARALVPALRARSAAATAARRVPDETIAALKRTGLLRLLQPAALGGLERDYADFIDIIRILTQGCASSAWVYGVLTEHAWVLASYPAEAQREVWGADPTAMSCASLVPTGTGERVAGGIRLSGRWPFASGCDHAQWAILGALVGEKDGTRAIHDCLVPIGALAIDDDWHVLGLAATGSKTLVAEGVRVPEHRVLRHEELAAGRAPGREIHPGMTLCRMPRSFIASLTLVAVLLGLAQRAVDEFADYTGKRSGAGGRRAGESEIVQLALAEAAAEADTALLLARTIATGNTSLVAAGETVTPERLLTARRDIAFAVKLARQAIDRLYALCGAHAIYDGAALQLIFRDAHAAAAHLFLKWEIGALPYGKLRLGLPAEPPF